MMLRRVSKHPSEIQKFFNVMLYTINIYMTEYYHNLSTVWFMVYSPTTVYMGRGGFIIIIIIIYYPGFSNRGGAKDLCACMRREARSSLRLRSMARSEKHFHKKLSRLVKFVNFPNTGQWDIHGTGSFYCRGTKSGYDNTTVSTFFVRSDSKFELSWIIFNTFLWTKPAPIFMHYKVIQYNIEL